MTSIYDTLKTFLYSFYEEENSFATEKKYTINDSMRKGEITLKWWKGENMLIIKHISLSTPNKEYLGNNLLTKSVKTFLEDVRRDNKEISSVVLESVSNHKLRQKLLEKGWHSRCCLTLELY